MMGNGAVLFHDEMDVLFGKRRLAGRWSAVAGDHELSIIRLSPPPIEIAKPAMPGLSSLKDAWPRPQSEELGSDSAQGLVILRTQMVEA